MRWLHRIRPSAAAREETPPPPTWYVIRGDELQSVPRQLRSFGGIAAYERPWA